jgi:hypothetical protein
MGPDYERNEGELENERLWQIFNTPPWARRPDFCRRPPRVTPKETDDERIARKLAKFDRQQRRRLIYGEDEDNPPYFMGFTLLLFLILWLFRSAVS